jgi:hypothetical protein
VGRAVLAAAGLVAAALCCAMAPDPSAKDGAPRDGLPPAQAAALCARLNDVGAACAPEFADLLVTLRAAYDVPFAETLETPEGLAAAKAEALRQVETGRGAPTEQRHARCAAQVKDGWWPLTEKDAALVERCPKERTCEERVFCLRPVVERSFQQRAARQRPP